MSYHYDIRGNLLLVKDPYNRPVFEHIYDLRTPEKDQPLPPLWTEHIDKGISSVLFDAVGKPIENKDAKGAQALSGFDVISRPVYAWACDNNGEVTTLRQFLIYGDDSTYSVLSPESVNLKGKSYQHYDEAGLVTTPSYDFKGNLLEKEQQVIRDSELLSIFTGSGPYICYRVDWTGVPASVPNIVDTTGHLTTIEYDALNRVTKMIYPWDLTNPAPERKELIPVYNRAGALESVSLSGTVYIEHIAYNAKSQRLMVAYGNGVMTRYAYDTQTFRLLRQRSESYTQSAWTYTSLGSVKQDTAYDYDLMGNITGSHERTTGCGIGGTNSLDRDYDYDAIYRVLSATGRENAPTITPIWDDSYRSANESLTTAYTQNYVYDKLGNIQTLQHIGVGNFTRNFNYTNTSNVLNSVDIGATNYAFSYDACGNQLTETSSRHWEWDAADRAKCFYVEASGSITQYTQYLYDSGGKRVKKLTWKAGGNYDSISYIDGVFEYRSDGTDEQALLHIMDNRNRIAMIRVGANFGDSMPAIQYNLEDLLGSSIIHLKADGSNLSKEEYYPFGETSFGSYAEKRYKYCGKERDNESGLYYYGARYYSAWICKFVSVDPLAAKYAQLSPYNYADNNPINDFDIDGMQNNNSQNSQQSQSQQNGQQLNTQNGRPYNPYESYGIQERTTTKPAGRWGRIACDACELDILRNNPNAMNIGTEGKIFYAPGVDVTGRMIWIKPQVTTNVNTVVATVPTGPGIIGNPIGPAIALQMPVNFTPATANLLPTGANAIANAVTALNIQGGNFVANGNPVMNVGPVMGPFPSTNLLSDTTNQITTVNQPGQFQGQTTLFTIGLSTSFRQTPAQTTLLTNRYNTIRNQMIALGVPAANINMGVLRFNQTPAQMGGNAMNSATFQAQQFNVNTPAQQTTTTTTTTTNDYK